MQDATNGQLLAELARRLNAGDEGLDLMTVFHTVMTTSGSSGAIWTIEDVQLSIANEDIELTDEQAVKVLKDVVEDHLKANDIPFETFNRYAVAYHTYLYQDGPSPR